MSKLSERRQQIREYNLGEAEQELERLRRQLFDLRIQQQRGEVKNNRQFTQVRTDIARLMYQLDVLNRVALADEEAEEFAKVEEAEEEGAAEAEEEAEGEDEAGAEASNGTETEAGAAAKEEAEENAPLPEKRGRRAKAKEEAEP